MLAHKRLAIDDQGDGVLEVGSDGQDRAIEPADVATAPGAYPRARRRITGPKAPVRTTESSTRRAIGRSPIRNASAIPERLPAPPRLRTRSVRWSDWHWSSPGLPERRPQTADGAVACTAASIRVRYCRARRLRACTFAGASTIGRATEVSSARPRRRAQPDSRPRSRSRTIRANGFSLRNLRSRKAATARDSPRRTPGDSRPVP